MIKRRFSQRALAYGLSAVLALSAVLLSLYLPDTLARLEVGRCCGRRMRNPSVGRAIAPANGGKRRSCFCWTKRAAAARRRFRTATRKMRRNFPRRSRRFFSSFCRMRGRMVCWRLSAASCAANGKDSLWRRNTTCSRIATRSGFAGSTPARKAAQSRARSGNPRIRRILRSGYSPWWNRTTRSRQAEKDAIAADEGGRGTRQFLWTAACDVLGLEFGRYLDGTEAALLLGQAGLSGADGGRGGLSGGSAKRWEWGGKLRHSGGFFFRGSAPILRGERCAVRVGCVFDSGRVGKRAGRVGYAHCICGCGKPL